MWPAFVAPQPRLGLSFTTVALHPPQTKSAFKAVVELSDTAHRPESCSVESCCSDSQWTSFHFQVIIKDKKLKKSGEGERARETERERNGE